MTLEPPESPARWSPVSHPPRCLPRSSLLFSEVPNVLYAAEKVLHAPRVLQRPMKSALGFQEDGSFLPKPLRAAACCPPAPDGIIKDPWWQLSALGWAQMCLVRLDLFICY